MKKIAIFTNNLELGGVEKSLLDFLKKIKNEKDYQLVLYVLEKKGKLVSEFQNIIEIIELKDLYFDLSNNAKKDIIDSINKLEFKKTVKIFNRKMRKILKKEDEFTIIDRQLILDKKFDVAICYQVPIHPLTIFVAQKVVASKKLLWNHAELASVDYTKVMKYKQVFTEYYKIFSVSNTSNQNCKNLLPDFNEKFDIFHNIIDSKDIIEKSKQKVNLDFNNNKVNLVTVGRLSEDKGYDLLINVADKMRNEKIDFYWYIIGDGELKKILIKQIKEKNLQDYIVLLGSKKNPYVYMKKCDIYVQTSRFEGYGITTLEAKILRKIVVTTNTSGIEEKFINEKDALITEMTEESLFNAIKKLIYDEELKKSIEDNILANEIIIPDDFHKLYNIVDHM